MCVNFVKGYDFPNYLTLNLLFRSTNGNTYCGLECKQKTHLRFTKRYERKRERVRE